MSADEFIIAVRSVLDVGDLAIDLPSTFAELGIDSLGMLELVVAMQDWLGGTGLSADLLFGIETVGDMYRSYLTAAQSPPSRSGTD